MQSAIIVLVLSLISTSYCVDYYFTPANATAFLNFAYSSTTALNGGDTITLAAGDYNYTVAGPGGQGIAVWFKNRQSGKNNAQPVILRGDPTGARPRIMAYGLTHVLYLTDQPGNKWVLEYLELVGSNNGNTAAAGHVGVCFKNRAYDTVLTNVIVNSCGNGVTTHDTEGGNLTVQYSEVKNCGAGGLEHSIYASRGLTDNGYFKLVNTYVHDCLGGNGIKSRFPITQLYYNWIDYNNSAGRAVEIISADCTPDNVTCLTVPIGYESDLVGNVIIVRTPGIGFHRLGRDTTGDPAAGKPPSWGKYRFAYNTYVGSASISTTGTAWGAITSVSCYNNIYYITTSTTLLLIQPGDVATGNYYGPLPTLKGSNNWVYTGMKLNVSNISFPGTFAAITATDPGFTSATSQNYALTSSSTCKSGALYPAPSDSLTVALPYPLFEPSPFLTTSPNMRASANSLGAFEFLSSSTSATPTTSSSSTSTTPLTSTSSTPLTSTSSTPSTSTSSTPSTSTSAAPSSSTSSTPSTSTSSTPSTSTSSTPSTSTSSTSSTPLTSTSSTPSTSSDTSTSTSSTSTSSTPSPTQSPNNSSLLSGYLFCIVIAVMFTIGQLL